MLKPEDAEKVLVKNLANVIRKANTGKPLTAAERALIEQAAAGGTLQDTGSAFAKTYDELAQRFGLTRKTLQNASKRFPDEAPQPRADGRHDVAAWSQFIIKHNIARSAENVAGAPSGEETQRPATVTDWKAQELKLKCTKLELENCKVAGELVDAAEVESGTSAMVQAFSQALNNFVPRLAQKILGITDYHEAEEIIQAEVDGVKKALQRCEFLGGIEPDSTAAAEKPLSDQEGVRSILSVDWASSKGLPRAGSNKARKSSRDERTVPPGKSKPSQIKTCLQQGGRGRNGNSLKCDKTIPLSVKRQSSRTRRK